MKYSNGRRNDQRNFETDDSEPLEIGDNLNQNRTRRATTMTTTHFCFGMTQTPFQIMSNWPLKFRNKKEDSLALFSEGLKIFKRGCKISSRDVLENLDALLRIPSELAER